MHLIKGTVIPFGSLAIKSVVLAILAEMPEKTLCKGEPASHGTMSFAASLVCFHFAPPQYIANKFQIHDAIQAIAPDGPCKAGSHMARLREKSTRLDNDQSWSAAYKEWRIALQNERYEF
jgi:hypothetical protein